MMKHVLGIMWTVKGNDAENLVIGRAVSEWTCRRYEYPEHVVEWIQNDTINWKKLNAENGGTYEYFARKRVKIYK